MLSSVLLTYKIWRYSSPWFVIENIKVPAHIQTILIHCFVVNHHNCCYPAGHSSGGQDDPGQGRDGDQEHEEHWTQTEELEIIGQVPGPACTHLTLRPEVVDVEDVPPPVLRTLAGVGHGTQRTGAGVVQQRL